MLPLIRSINIPKTRVRTVWGSLQCAGPLWQTFKLYSDLDMRQNWINQKKIWYCGHGNKWFKWSSVWLILNLITLMSLLCTVTVHKQNSCFSNLSHCSCASFAVNDERVHSPLRADAIQRQMTKGIEAETDLTSKSNVWWIMKRVT